MMEKANISIAMGNAVEEIKQSVNTKRYQMKNMVWHMLYINMYVIKEKESKGILFFLLGKVFYEIHRSLITFHYIEYIGINVYIFHEICEYFMNFILVAFYTVISDAYDPQGKIQ